MIAPSAPFRLLGASLLFVFLVGCAQSMFVSVSPQGAFVGASQHMQFAATVVGTSNASVTWSVNGVVGGTSTTGTIDASGNYLAPAVTQNAKATITATSTTDNTKSSSAMISIMAPGLVTTTNEPQVAQYTITPPANAQVSIEFGPDSGYGRSTWTQPTPAGGGPVSIYVAGMLANTTYHMRAVVSFTGSNTVDDSDHTFTTAAFPSNEYPSLTAATTPGSTPQSGVELLDFFDISQTPQLSVVVTDLSGNVLWGYAPNLPGGYGPNPVKLMPNGDFIINESGNPDGTNSIIEEVDLGGNVVWSMTAAQLNQELAAATCAGCNIIVVGTHHDIAVLPNGHLIVIASENVVEHGLVGYPSAITVTGDVLIDLDQNHQPVWLWSSFDHLDLNRHPLAFPDWTHTNTVVYSPDDGDLIVSLRHQDWILKINYDDGHGDGSIVWTLGYQGDFTLQNGTDPVDWTYAQHDANVVSSNSSGTFQITMFDNGNNRVLDSSGTICSSTTTPCWSRVPIYQVNEATKTATLEWVDDLSPYFSLFGGSARLLPNGNVEFAECYPTTTEPGVYEVTQTNPPQPVWEMRSTQPVYRGTRIPSLYPGVQW